ncbi:MAG TPA: hypothetical protein VEJ89_16595 [Myxococcaceae bacterium]|jgi:hypothetical protein|nr:hypothetical protein [Myxococcaceae bacterium]
MPGRPQLRPLAALGLVAATASLVLLSLPRLLGLAGGAGPEVASVLTREADPPVSLRLAGDPSPLRGRALDFRRITVAEEGEGRARAVSTLDFDGALGGTRVSSLGREITHFRRRAGGWELDGSLAPTLAGAVSALAARSRALERGDTAALAALVAPRDRDRAMADPGLRRLLESPAVRTPPRAWYLRSEADEVTISEERGDPPQLRRLVLVPRSPGSAEFVFAGSLL